MRLLGSCLCAYLPSVAATPRSVTEAAALGAGWWVGKGDKNGADRAAVDNMRKTLRGVSMDGTVVIGEGEKDQAPMLYRREGASG